MVYVFSELKFRLLKMIPEMIPSELPVAITLPPVERLKLQSFAGSTTPSVVLESVTPPQSLIVMVFEQVEVFPQLSVAIHVLTSVPFPQPFLLSTVENVSDSRPQASDADAIPQSIVAPQRIVWFGGQVMLGGPLSCTVIVALQVLVLLQSSVARQTRV
jgi:hypothetical protein